MPSSTRSFEIRRASCVGLVIALVGALVSAGAAEVPIPAAPQIGAKSYVLVDFASGKVLANSEADESLDPASLTKLMTAYVVFEALAQGQISLSDSVRVSEKAWRTPGSRMFIEVGTQVPVEDLLQGMIVQSGNDASVALAEYTAGTEEAFVELMNHYAAELGMSGTHFVNSTGLPAEGHVSTARDIAALARALIKEFPDYYHWYSQREYSYNDITQHNRNLLLWRDPSVDGLKTGHTEDAGYCLVTSAERSGMRLISVVMGTASEEARAAGSEALLNYGFRFYETDKLYSRGEEITNVKVWKGSQDNVGLGLADDLYVTIPRGRYDALSAAMKVPDSLMAPIGTNAKVGEVEVALDGETLASAPLLATAPVEVGSFWDRLKDDVLMWFQ